MHGIPFYTRSLKWKLNAILVAHILTDDQKEACSSAFNSLLETAVENLDFCSSIVAGNETLCLQYDPQTKWQSAEWRGIHSLLTQKVCLQQSRTKVMWIACFNCKGIIHKEFITLGQMVNKDLYKQILHLCHSVCHHHSQLCYVGIYSCSIITHSSGLCCQFSSSCHAVRSLCCHMHHIPSLCCPASSSCSPG